MAFGPIKSSKVHSVVIILLLESNYGAVFWLCATCLCYVCLLLRSTFIVVCICKYLELIHIREALNSTSFIGEVTHHLEAICCALILYDKATYIQGWLIRDSLDLTEVLVPILLAIASVQAP